MKLRVLFGMAAILWLSGCSTMRQGPVTEEEDSDGATVQQTSARKGGAELWSQRCTQCHFARDPGTFSQQEWEMIMLHMRVRANLTAAEHRAILGFFGAAGKEPEQREEEEQGEKPEQSKEPEE
jgi:hypothetical protein